MKNPHIIVGEPRRCLCGMYGIAELLGERPTSCADILAALERQVQTGSADARLLCEAMTPLVKDCDAQAAQDAANLANYVPMSKHGGVELIDQSGN